MGGAKTVSNVVVCPNCARVFGESESSFVVGRERDTFNVTHRTCDYTWTAHQREFYPKEGRPPRCRNPFDPVRLV